MGEEIITVLRSSQIMTGTIQAQLESRASQVPGTTVFFARNLTTGETVERGADNALPTMSVGKVFLLLAYVDGVTSNQIDPGQRITLGAGDMLPGTGALRFCVPGLSLAYADLAALMITHSDNVATNMLLRVLGGPDVVNEVLDKLGIRDARCLSPIFQGDFSVSSPRALAQAYTILHNLGTLGWSESAAELARSILLWHQDVEGMSRYLPWSPHAADFGIELPLKVYSKSGQFPGTQVEAGLYVTARGAFVAAAMITGIEDPRTHSPAPGSQFLADFGRMLYEAWGA
jgi:beta-lactamase class A